jgi:hypothetical protein
MRRLEICQRLAWNRRRRKIALVTLVCVATAIAAVVGAFSMRTSAESAASPMNATVLEKA